MHDLSDRACFNARIDIGFACGEAHLRLFG